MGWERRGNRMYLYLNRRVNGRPVKEYLGAANAFAGLMDLELEEARAREADDRARRRALLAEPLDRMKGVLTILDRAGGQLRIVADGMLSAIGYHRHNRGEWRMKRGIKGMAETIETLRGSMRQPKPLLDYQAPAGDAEAVEVFARARAGDAAAQARVRTFLVERDWVTWVGDLGRQATVQLIERATAGDPVWKAGLTETGRRPAAGSCSGRTRRPWTSCWPGGW
jgi:hypothetical protein